MTCSDGVCAPTASDAVLNVNDLENLLAAGTTKVTTTGNGVQAGDVVVKAALSWTGSSGLTLDAYQSITVEKAVSVGGRSTLRLSTGKKGALSFGRKGHVTFADLSSRLVINGAAYALVDTLKALASAIAADPDGNFALADDYNAKRDGAYSTSPVTMDFDGDFEGLGHVVRNLTLDVSSDATDYIGLFSRLDPDGTIRDIGLENIQISVPSSSTQYLVGTLLGESGNDQTGGGAVVNSYAAGSVSVGAIDSTWVGGLVGFNEDGSSIVNSHSDCSVSVGTDGYMATAGGLAAYNQGVISSSYATGDVSAVDAGGLVGYNVGPSGDRNAGRITDTYATGNVSGADLAGGLIGENDGGNAGEHAGTVHSSYATGAPGSGGGFVDDSEGDGLFASDYWDTTTSGTDVGCVTGPCYNVTGLTTRQLKSGLPHGFDPSVWAENANINNGLPYLIANPPRK